MSLVDAFSTKSDSQQLQSLTANTEHFPMGPANDYFCKLVRGLVHKHNNFLTIAQGYSDLLLNSPGNPADRQSSLEAISKCTRRAVELNHRVIACASDDEPHIKLISIKDFLDPRKPLYQGIARRHDLTIECQNELQDTQLIATDPYWLEVILEEIFHNACEARETTEVIYAARLIAETTVQLEIRDNGEGISSDVLPRVFDPFFSKKEREHLGIGLTRAGILSVKLGITLTIHQLERGTRVSLEIPTHLNNSGEQE
ncbi:sensor histidine kinase [Roseibacillus ishigakijimensis]|uniref:histidine kinase n=1 Tax=Roseibacillus ishigakijimensis TaxID=454146 RepID=A0A934RUX0_9BACT|nr:HAMP domain-containing sensor histidine kinase [Roseibacillus ishigakijimensis]MBK1834615.1 HAMP domain-containing histidine kinase [Roseibacillus ishigakijimensis]